MGEGEAGAASGGSLWLPAPDEYEGGELIISDTYGEHEVKLPAGDLVVYPSSSLHQVRPVTRGARVASFFWVQSMIRDDVQRRLLWEMDGAIEVELSAQPVGGQQQRRACLLGRLHRSGGAAAQLGRRLFLQGCFAATFFQWHLHGHSGLGLQEEAPAKLRR